MHLLWRRDAPELGGHGWHDKVVPLLLAPEPPNASADRCSSDTARIRIEKAWVIRKQDRRGDVNS